MVCCQAQGEMVGVKTVIHIGHCIRDDQKEGHETLVFFQYQGSSPLALWPWRWKSQTVPR